MSRGRLGPNGGVDSGDGVLEIENPPARDDRSFLGRRLILDVNRCDAGMLHFPHRTMHIQRPADEADIGVGDLRRGRDVGDPSCSFRELGDRHEPNIRCAKKCRLYHEPTDVDRACPAPRRPPTRRGRAPQARPPEPAAIKSRSCPRVCLDSYPLIRCSSRSCARPSAIRGGTGRALWRSPPRRCRRRPSPRTSGSATLWHQ